MLEELKMTGFEQPILRCFTLAHEGGATIEELQELYYLLLSSDY